MPRHFRGRALRAVAGEEEDRLGQTLPERDHRVRLRRPDNSAEPGLLVRTRTKRPLPNSPAVLTNGSSVSSPSIGLTVIASGVAISSLADMSGSARCPAA